MCYIIKFKTWLEGAYCKEQDATFTDPYETAEFVMNNCKVNMYRVFLSKRYVSLIRYDLEWISPNWRNTREVKVFV